MKQSISGVDSPLTYPHVIEITRSFCSSLLPPLSRNIHKGDRGGCLVIGGCHHYRGAPLLSLRGFLRAGGGIAVLLADEEICTAASSFIPEAIFLSGLLCATDSAIKSHISEWEPRTGCLIVGPGMGRSERAGEVFALLWHLWKKDLIVDGDGLYWLKKNERSFFPRRERVLLTPHEGEAGMLLGVPSEEIASHRLKAARTIAEQWGVVLLKGADTLVDDGKRTASTSEGTPLLAVPGSGDVLAGAIGAFAARGMPLYESACLGAWIHASAGRTLTEHFGQDGTLAREIADALPAVLKDLRLDR
ncbi:MAG: NAD(P)H-hydrate dehydratase [Synergistaceae bacterium]|nr:NAD(P)H-hydrate dehydratase [Synergistaceae bacterium]